MAYPTSIWDGNTPNRDRSLAQKKSPNWQDWNVLTSELIAVENKLGVGSREDGSVETGVTQVSDSSLVQKTVLSLKDISIACAEGTTKEFGSSLLFTFPKGAIKVLGVVVDLKLTSTDYSAVEEGDLALGDIAATDRALTGQDVTWLAATALTFATGESTVQSHGDIVAVQDGTTTPNPVYLNIAMDNDGGAGTIVVNGTITITWVNLGDY